MLSVVNLAVYVPSFKSIFLSAAADEAADEAAELPAAELDAGAPDPPQPLRTRPTASKAATANELIFLIFKFLQNEPLGTGLVVHLSKMSH